MKAGTYKARKTTPSGHEFYVLEDRCGSGIGMFFCKRRAGHQGMHECPYSATETAVWVQQGRENRKNGS